ncbi:hypothetical protein J3454_15985 [Erythrobacter sp. NFXS35]|uniref:hypothetical protein n=1 Tax=Erythrobacter sp. NFXS35 TaxID=2818436 RepID=UPI0032DEBF5C
MAQKATLNGPKLKNFGCVHPFLADGQIGRFLVSRKESGDQLQLRDATDDLKTQPGWNANPSEAPQNDGSRSQKQLEIVRTQEQSRPDDNLLDPKNEE